MSVKPENVILRCQLKNKKSGKIQTGVLLHDYNCEIDFDAEEMLIPIDSPFAFALWPLGFMDNLEFAGRSFQIMRMQKCNDSLYDDYDCEYSFLKQNKKSCFEQLTINGIITQKKQDQYRERYSLDTKLIVGNEDKVYRVQENVFVCLNKTHHLLDVLADISFITADGKLSTHSIPAGYCPECKVFFVLDVVLSKFESEYGKSVCVFVRRNNNYWYPIHPYVDWGRRSFAEASVLSRYGYTVNQDSRLSEENRRDILVSLITAKVATLSEIISYLNMFISLHSGMYNHQYAVRKWMEDRDYLIRYFAVSKKH